MQQSRFKVSNCQLCLKNYDNYYHIPRVLPKCGHTFCQKCIKAKLQQKRGRLTFVCSECETETMIRKSVADELPKNITIADLVKDVRLKTLEKEQQNEIETGCTVHGKKLEMVCLSCNGVRICPHCAVFGDHKGHNIGNELGASKQDLRSLKQIINMIQLTINEMILPNSPSNIEKTNKLRLIQSLQHSIKQNFKPYYQEVARREAQLLQQCQSIVIDEKAGECLDDILTAFDVLKLRGGELEKGTVSEVGEVMERARELNGEIERVVASYNQSIDAFLGQARAKIRDAHFFDVHLSDKRNLKAILKGNLSPEIKTKQKQVIKSLQVKQQQPSIKKSQLIRQKQPLLQRKKTDSLLTDKIQNKPKIINAASTTASRVKTQRVMPKQQSTEQPPLNMEHKRKSNAIENQPEVISRLGTTRNVKALSIRKSELGRSGDKHQQRDKSPINMINQPIDLKFTKPTKQLNYQFRSKFQSILAQIDRQHPQGTLQLIGLQIGDVLIPYICEYLQTKRLKFSMIKLVKNAITDQGFRILLSYLSTDTYTKVLNLTGNHLTAKSLPYILYFINVNNICKMIYLSNNKINGGQLRKVQAGLESKFMQVII